MAKVVGAPRHSYMAWWGVLWKNEIRDFWDVRVGKAYKCPQMNTMTVLVHESFEFGGFCTWPRLAMYHSITRWLRVEFCEKLKFVVFEMWGLERPTNVPKWIPWKSWCMKVEFGEFYTWPRLAVHQGIATWLGGEFCEKMKFVIFEMWGFERPTNVPKWIPWNSWCTIVLGSEGFAHGEVGWCTTAYLDGLVKSFVKNWNSWFLRCEVWIGLQMPPNEYHESLGARKFWVRRVLHMAKLVGAPRHS